MDTHGTAQRIVAILLVAASAAAAFGSSVRIYGGSFNLPIPDKGRMADATINVPDHHIISDIDVGISVVHTNVFDLQLFLQSPAGTRICLNMYNAFDNFFKGANYTETIFDDEAEVPIEQAAPPFTGRFKPLADFKLSAFDGKDAYGPWRLQIYDAFYYDTGTLNSFEIMVENPEPETILLFTLGAGLIRLRKRPKQDL